MSVLMPLQSLDCPEFQCYLVQQVGSGPSQGQLQYAKTPSFLLSVRIANHG